MTQKRVLISVYDKTGLEDFARDLVSLGWMIVSSGGTSSALAKAQIAHQSVDELTGWPEMLGGRVKTLHPMVHGGILANRSEASHVADLETHKIPAFDMVVCNLYPFTSKPSIELIDVGGPTMVRAAAKNHAHVASVVDPAEYPAIIAELKDTGELSLNTKKKLARDAFAHTASYDAAIVSWFDGEVVENPAGEPPPSIHLSLERAEILRYGENPHQWGARYRESGQKSWWDGVTQHSGMALSYLNLFDAEAAWRLVHEDESRACAAVVKHANPCGVAWANEIAVAYEEAFACDPTSAFGGIVALNRNVSTALAEELVANPKADVIIAPGFTPEAIEMFAKKRKNMRVLQAPKPGTDEIEFRRIDGGFLVQQMDTFIAARDSWKVVTKSQPTPEQWADLEVAWRVCAYVKSNAIVLAKDGVAWGIGGGQPSRLDAGKIAAEKAAGRAKGGACASDAFFPFRDGLDMVVAAGAVAIIQPGGSMRDEEVIAAADEHGVAMVFTGERHFRH